MRERFLLLLLLCCCLFHSSLSSPFISHATDTCRDNAGPFALLHQCCVSLCMSVCVMGCDVMTICLVVRAASLLYILTKPSSHSRFVDITSMLMAKLSVTDVVDVQRNVKVVLVLGHSAADATEDEDNENLSLLKDSGMLCEVTVSTEVRG